MPFGTIARWISGDDPNRRARAAESEQQKALDTQTSLSNQYNRNIYLTEKANYAEESKYAYDTAVTNWEYGKKIQDYQYAQSLAVFDKSEDIYYGQLGYNEQAASLAVNDQKAYIQDLSLSQAFQREAMHADLMTEIKKGGIQKLEQGAKLYGIKSNRRISSEDIQQQLNQVTTKNTFEKEAKFVESLQKSGKAALGQAGVSRAKSLQSTAAESFRDLTTLSSSLSGSRNKAAVDLLKVYADASLGETQVNLNLDRIELGINAAREEVKYNNKILSANMESAIGQMGRNIEQIKLQKRQADLQAKANLNLFPEEFDYAPEPQMPPERIFVEPPEFVSPTVPKGPRVSKGIDSVFEVVSEVGEIVATVMGLGDAAKDLGLDKLFDFGGKSSSIPFPTNIGSVTGNTLGDFGGGTPFDFGSVTGNTLGDFGGGSPFDF